MHNIKFRTAAREPWENKNTVGTRAYWSKIFYSTLLKLSDIAT